MLPLLFVLVSFCSHAQTAYIDSLSLSLKSATVDTIKMQLLDKMVSYYFARNYDSSLYYGYQRLRIAEKIGAKKEKIRALNDIGYSLTTAANYNAALEIFLEAKKLGESEPENEQFLAASYHLIGNLYAGQKNYRDAIDYYKKAWEINLKLNSKGYTYTSLMNLGSMYLEINQLDSALYFSQRAYERALQQDKTYFPSVLKILGNVHERLGNKELALSYYRQSLSENQRQNSPGRSLSALYIDLSKFFKTENRNDSAFYYANAAIKLLQGTTFISQLLTAYLNISELYSNKGDSAYKYLKIATSLKDSIFSTQKVQQFQNMRYQEDLRGQQMEEKKRKELDERKHNLQYAAIALGIVMFVILFFVLSHSIMANQNLIRFLGILALLIVFEFLNLFLHPFLDKITNHQPVLMLAAMVCIAALLIPLHHKLEHWITHKMVEKNKKIRLAAAKKTIASLETESIN